MKKQYDVDGSSWRLITHTDKRDRETIHDSRWQVSLTYERLCRSTAGMGIGRTAWKVIGSVLPNFLRQQDRQSKQSAIDCHLLQEQIAVLRSPGPQEPR